MLGMLSGRHKVDKQEVFYQNQCLSGSEKACLFKSLDVQAYYRAIEKYFTEFKP